jgi:hypothetical protein
MENIRHQLGYDIAGPTERPVIISREAMANIASVTRGQLLSDIGEGAIGTRHNPKFDYTRSRPNKRGA